MHYLFYSFQMLPNTCTHPIPQQGATMPVHPAEHGVHLVRMHRRFSWVLCIQRRFS